MDLRASRFSATLEPTSPAPIIATRFFTPPCIWYFCERSQSLLKNILAAANEIMDRK